MLITMTAAVLAVTAASSSATLVNHGVDARVLKAALQAPVRPRVPGEGPRYCVLFDEKPGAANQSVCRTWKQWGELGVKPVR